METYKLLNIFIAAGCLSSIITFLAVGIYYVIILFNKLLTSII